MEALDDYGLGTHVLDRASRLAARAFVIISSRERRSIRHRLGGFADHVLGHGVRLRQQGIEPVRADGIDLEVELFRLGEKIRILGRALEGGDQRRLAIRGNAGRGGKRARHGLSDQHRLQDLLGSHRMRPHEHA